LTDLQSGVLSVTHTRQHSQHQLDVSVVFLTDVLELVVRILDGCCCCCWLLVVIVSYLRIVHHQLIRKYREMTKPSQNKTASPVATQWYRLLLLARTTYYALSMGMNQQFFVFCPW